MAKVVAKSNQNFAKIQQLSQDRDGSKRPITVRTIQRVGGQDIPIWDVDLPITSKGKIILDPYRKPNKIKLIYFINCRVSSLYGPIFRRHLQELNESGIGDDPNFQLIVVAAGSTSDINIIYSIIKEMIPTITNQKDPSDLKSSKKERLEIRLTETSVYELDGIHTYWKEAQCSKNNDILFYAHCKGVSHLKEIKGSLPFQSIVASQLIMRNIYKNISILQAFPVLNKLGVLQGGATNMNVGRRGWMFWNFYACRAKYVKRLPEPNLSNNRFNYEFWLGLRTNKNDLQRNPAIGLNDGISLLAQPNPSVGFRIDGKDVGSYLATNMKNIQSSLQHDRNNLAAYKNLVTQHNQPK